MTLHFFLNVSINKYPINIKSFSKYYGLQSENLDRIYKDHLSGFDDWNQKSHAEDFILYPKNIGKYMSIDETSFSNGKLYTILTNKNKAYIKMLKWIYKVDLLDNKIFNTASRSIMNYMDKILNYFDNRNTNDSAESFNAKLKAFRSQCRGVIDIKLF